METGIDNEQRHFSFLPSNSSFVQGSDCSVVIKTVYREFDVPYAEETLREAVSLLQEKASVEGDGVCRAIRKSGGVTGCVITPLTIGTVPHLLYLAMGATGKPVFVSETRNLYRYTVDLLPMEDTELFDLIQMRQRTMNSEQLTMNNERLLYEGCRVKGFELRVMRGEAVKLRLDIFSERPPAVYPYTDSFERSGGERFHGDFVTYSINGKEYSNIYGVTLVSKKEGGTKTELWVKRVLDKDFELPNIIEEITITARLLRDKYECRQFGTFCITAKRLVLLSDETNVNTADTVIGPVRYYVAGTVSDEVFESNEQ